MNSNVCGYGPDARDDKSGARLTAAYGIESGCVDVGRDEDGVLRSFVTTQESPGTVAPPRLFEPTQHSAQPVLPITRAESDSIHRLSAQWGPQLVGLKKHCQGWVSGNRRRATLIASVGVLATGVALLAIPPSASTSQVTRPQESSQAPSSIDLSGVPTHIDMSDPVNSSVELALSGAIAGLGNMQGVARASVQASIASRAGDIVLIDLAVTKPTGLTTFATVLLQKVGSQWRMRQIVDERN